MEVAATSLAGKIGVVGRRSKTDSLGCPREHVAYLVGEVLKQVGRETNVIMDDVVMSRLRRALKAAMR